MRYEIIGDVHISNCIIEALKAKIRDPKNVKVYICKPRITENKCFQQMHAIWTDENAAYDFSECPPVQVTNKRLIYRGCVKKFELETAMRYVRYRNSYRIMQGRY